MQNKLVVHSQTQQATTLPAQFLFLSGFGLRDS